MSGGSHSAQRLAEDEQDVIGQPVARVLEQEPDHAIDCRVQVGQGQRRGHAIVPVEEAPGAVTMGTSLLYLVARIGSIVPLGRLARPVRDKK